MIKKLINEAFSAMNFSYSPYSSFKVGAALLTKSGKIYSGCNIENASYSPTNCAERTAIFKAVSEGETDFDSIVIVSQNKYSTNSFCPPCGVCRQVLAEFCDSEHFKIILAKSTVEYKIYTLKDLLPLSFDKEQL